MTIQNDSDDLLAFITSLPNTGNKDWFGFSQQRILGIYLAYELAKRYAPVMSAKACAVYASELNNAIHEVLVAKKR